MKMIIRAFEKKGIEFIEGDGIRQRRKEIHEARRAPYA